MDIGVFIVILIVMYVIPEVMKRLKPKKPYQYPEFPSPQPSDQQEPTGIPGALSRGMKPPPVPAGNGEGTPGDEGDPTWGLRWETPLPEVKGFVEESHEGVFLENNRAALGFIWAEIISPPVALRPRRYGARRF